MINLKMGSLPNPDSESAKVNRRQPKIPKQFPFYGTQTPPENYPQQPMHKTELIRAAQNQLFQEQEEKPRNALKLPQIGKRTSENFQENNDAVDRKQNQNQGEENRGFQTNPLLRKYADRRSTEKLKSEDSANFLSIIGMKPTIRSTSRMSSKDVNKSLGYDRLERPTLLKEEDKNRGEEADQNTLDLKSKKRRVSTNCKSSTSQKIQSSSRPKRSILALAANEKKKSSLLIKVEKPRQSPSYYDWCLFVGVLDGMISQKQTGPTYKAFVGKGNNSILVKSIIKNRPWWTLCQDQTEAHLFWSQSRSPKFLEGLKQMNEKIPFDWDGQIKSKMHLFGNIQGILSEKIKDCVGLGFHKLLTVHERQVLCKSQVSVNLLYPKELKILEGNKSKIHNHLEFNWNLTNKKALYYNMKAFYQAVGKEPFEHIPETYHVQKEGDDEWNRFLKGYQKKGFWIIKPGENSNQGCGIDVADSLEDVREIVRNKSTRANGKPRSHIIQRYLMPFLYNKRKFDIRCYILATSINGNLRCYWYEQGYIRTASKEFNTKNLKNRMIHLTNDAVQKHSQTYGKYENANKLSFVDFQKYAKTVRPDKDFFEDVYPRMIQLAADAIRATHLVMDAKHRQFTFEVFGLDFMIDDLFNTWLIEVNTNPCLELCCPLLARLIPSMLENAFRIAVDPLFPPPKDYPRHKGLLEQLFESNKFSLIFSSRQEADLSRVLQPSRLDDIIESQQESECELKDD